MSKVRRGVHMTATARKPKASWREEIDEDLTDDEIEASRDDWKTLEDEVAKERRKLGVAAELAAGRRGVDVVEYTDTVDVDVAAAEEAEAARVAAKATARAKEEAERDAIEEEAATRIRTDMHALEKSRPDDRAEPDDCDQNQTQKSPSGAQSKKRGGKHRTGAKRKRKKDEAEEEDDRQKKRKENPDKWLKLTLIGENKPKRIDATRIVHYHDFDNNPDDVRGALEEPVGSSSSAAVASSSSQYPPTAGISGNMRALVRSSMWDDDDDDDDE